MNKLIIIIILFSIACNSRRTIQSREQMALECKDYLKVSFEELSKQPSYYHNKKIRIDGYFYSGFEEFAIYESKKSNDSKPGVWIDFNDKLNLYQNNKYKEFEEKKLDLIGIYDAEEHGHLNQYLGELLVLCVNESK